MLRKIFLKYSRIKTTENMFYWKIKNHKNVFQLWHRWHVQWYAGGTELRRRRRGRARRNGNSQRATTTLQPSAHLSLHQRSTTCQSQRRSRLQRHDTISQVSRAPNTATEMDSSHDGGTVVYLDRFVSSLWLKLWSSISPNRRLMRKCKCQNETTMIHSWC